MVCITAGLTWFSLAMSSSVVACRSASAPIASATSGSAARSSCIRPSERRSMGTSLEAWEGPVLAGALLMRAWYPTTRPVSLSSAGA